MPQPAHRSASPGVPEGWHASTCPGIQFSGGWPALTCLGIRSPGGCHSSACLGIRILTQGHLALRLQQNWVGYVSKRLTTHGNWRRPISFFLFLPVITVFHMVNNQSTSWQTSLRCILDNWKLFNPLTLRRSCLKFFCATVWPWYPLGDKEH